MQQGEIRVDYQRVCVCVCNQLLILCTACCCVALISVYLIKCITFFIAGNVENMMDYEETMVERALMKPGEKWDRSGVLKINFLPKP